jgi:hypothetical protein
VKFSSKRRTVRLRPRLEQLEDRNLLSYGQWMAVFNGLSPADTLGQQAQNGANLLHASGLNDADVQVTSAVDLSGTFLVQAPPTVTQSTLTAELQNVPGFVFVQDYTPDKGAVGEDNNGGINAPDLINGDAYNAQFGPFDYNAFVAREKSGQVPPDGGPVPPPPVGTDVLVSDTAGSNGSEFFTQSETSTIAFGNTVLVSFNDSGSNAAASNKFTGWSRSTDGGLTFTDGGTLPTNPNGDVGDPVLARSSLTGRVFFATLQFSGSGLDVFHSDDGGATWSSPVQGAPGKNGFQDKEWIAVDNSTAAGAGYGNVYLVNRDFGSGNGIFFYRSTDNGATFGPNGGTAIALSGATQGAFVTVTPDHAVEVFWFDGSFLRMRKSTDQGLSFGAPVNVVSNLVGGVNGDLNLVGTRQGTSSPAYFRSNEFPHVAVNPVNGNLYLTYDNKGAGNDKADVFLVQSTNGGATWSAPIKVNDDTTNTDQWQPTVAVTPDGSKIGVFYYSRQEDPTNDNLFKYYGRVGTISGSTINFAPSFAVSTVASLPEFGRDPIVNSVYMGDYNTAYATPGAFEVSWSDNRDNLPNGGGRKNPNVYFERISLGLQVTTTVPAVGSIIFTQPTTFTVNVTDPINPASLSASAFKVNGIAATSDSYAPGSTTITFSFASSPVTAEGLQTMHVDAGAFTRASDGNPVGQFDGTFRYSTGQLAVVSTNPAVGGTFIIPPATATFDVNFNRAFDPNSVQTSSLTLSGIPGAFVSGVTYLNGNTTAEFTLGGLTSDSGTLTASIAAGAIRDTAGNPGVAFSGNYFLDITSQAFPTPLAPLNPRGSLVYDPTVSDSINFAGDSESYTLGVGPGQTITVLVSPTSPGLRPTVVVFDPSSTILGIATATAAGQNALIQTVPAAAGGTYTITISGVGGTTGNFTVQVYLNAALDVGNVGVGSNTTLATAQNINPTFTALQTSLAHATRGAVVGQTDNSGYGAVAVTPTFEDISATGHGTLQGTDDSVIQLTPANLGTFTFPFYGTTYNTLYYNTNALISFGVADSAFGNTDLTNSPNEPVIAPLWTDYVAFDPSSVVYWQVLGSGASQHLVIEWKNVQYFPGGGVFLTFEAVLNADGTVQFNYQNVNNAVRGTAGLKAAGAQGPNRLLLAFNNGPNALVGNNKSTRTTPPNPGADYYSFSLDAGQHVTVAAAGLTSGNLTLDLRNGSDTVLATGVGGATNLNKVISDFVALAASTYYVRLSGDSNVPYTLVVTKDAAFDTEPNGTFATAQDVSGRQGALGAIAAGGTGAYQATAVTPTFEDISATGHGTLQGTDDSTITLGPALLGTFQFPFYGTTYNTLYYSTNALVSFGVADGAYSNTDLTNSPNEPAIAPLWTDYVAFDPSSVVYWQVLGSGSSQHLVIEWKNVQYFPGGGAFLTFEAVLNADGSIQFNYQNANNGVRGTAGLKAAGAQGPNRLLLAFNNGPNAFVGNNKSTRIAQPAPDDWYKVTLGAGQTALQLETTTPGGAGASQFVNNLIPHIQLFNSSNVLLADGVKLADNRNESLLATGLTPGATYYVRLQGQNSTSGEYFLGTTPLLTPTPTVVVDNDSWGFQSYGPGWNLVNTGYRGDELTHAGGGTGANFAEWDYGDNFTAGTSYKLFATWVADPANADNATYTVMEDWVPIANVTVNQRFTPNSAIYDGALWQSLFSYSPSVTGFHIVSLVLSDAADGNVSADAIFDPPEGGGGAAVAGAAVAADGAALGDVGAVPALLPAPGDRTAGAALLGLAALPPPEGLAAVRGPAEPDSGLTALDSLFAAGSLRLPADGPAPGLPLLAQGTQAGQAADGLVFAVPATTVETGNEPLRFERPADDAPPAGLDNLFAGTDPQV